MLWNTLTRFLSPLLLPCLFALALAACDDGTPPPRPKTIWEISYTTADGPLRDLWFTDWELGYAAGESKVYKWDGWVWDTYADFRADFPGWRVAFIALAAPAADDVWVVGEASRGDRTCHVFHYDGRTWEMIPVAGLTAARDVYFLAADDGWIAGNGLYHYDGEEWTRVAAITAEHLSFTALDEGFACTATALYRWDGASWKRQTLDLAAGDTLNGLTSKIGSGAMAVGTSESETGLVFKFAGGGWDRLTPPGGSVTCADMLNFQEVWTGGLGATWYYDGEEFHRYALPSADLQLRTIQILNRRRVWACGGEDAAGRGYVLRFDGFR